jgi:hypothetical protein
VQGCNQILSSFKDVAENFTRVTTRHSIVPQVDNYHDVFNAHFLKQTKQLLPAAFFVVVVEALCYVGLVRVCFTLSSNAISYDASFRLLYASSLTYIVKHKFYMILVTNGS